MIPPHTHAHTLRHMHTANLSTAIWLVYTQSEAYSEETYSSQFLRHHHHQAVFHWPVRTSHRLLISGQDCNANSFIIGHTGLSTSLNCPQPDPSTSEPSTRSCSVLLLSFSPPNLSHMVWNQTYIALAILITDRCWGKWKVSVNDSRRFLNRDIIRSS